MSSTIASMIPREVVERPSEGIDPELDAGVEEAASALLRLGRRSTSEMLAFLLLLRSGGRGCLGGGRIPIEGRMMRKPGWPGSGVVPGVSKVGARGIPPGKDRSGRRNPGADNAVVGGGGAVLAATGGRPAVVAVPVVVEIVVVVAASVDKGRPDNA